MRYRIIITFLILFAAITLGAQDQSYIRHKVRWMETLYSIARKYKVDPKDIALLNELRTGEISRGQVLLIPHKDPPAEEYVQDTIPETLHAVDLPESEAQEEFPCADFIATESYRPVVSLILPMSGPTFNNGFLEFYQGALLAVDKMKNQGMRFTLQVFDWNEQPVDDLLSGDKLGSSDLIIGPVYATEIGSALAYFRHSQIKIVSPLDPGAEIWVGSSPNLFQVQSTLKAQQEALIKYLEPHQATLWIISEEGEAVVSPEIRALLDNSLIPYRNFSYDVLQGREVTQILRELLSSNPRNQIIIASQNEAFVSDALRNLHLLMAYDNIPVELFGLSRWRSFETLDLTALHQLQVMLPLSAYVDYTLPEVKEFVRNYRMIFHGEPSPYAFQGYDVAYYFLNALYRLGPRFENCLDTLKLPGLQNGFWFSRNEAGSGFSNKGVRVVRYLPDFTVELLP
ncbi:MAG: LysM peptidoglycan-binding domain-containing protein [Bacteroidales bacterium]|jgi:LysM repeat protein|nr:LysM peptidoglycan-binding domain-containing protein [Bacteroidales bacterium]MDD3099837.1 LysM peptidoglycan-binding domain-containing protein [Bacteroidales bacterium]MDD3638657.1 LysM peptidoglycan-binding domain-containing protein [Bacteroidales bacterium]MDD3943216.1 LysM peptidoglycan-binding domain-containing protein [Bacteroidales bacterium]MDD4480779.1 LysM peptidoglycan-binding domain-containing protein [Bacteroidales bacterium]